jgi:hypothetical protein
MSAYEATGSIVGYASFAVNVFDYYVRGWGSTTPFKAWPWLVDSRRQFRHLSSEYGWFRAWLLLRWLTKALAVMERVEMYVLHARAEDSIAFKDSFSSSFNMIAVAVCMNVLSFISRKLAAWSLMEPTGCHCRTSCHYGAFSTTPQRNALDGLGFLHS